MDFGRALWEVARKEILQHIRTKRLVIIGLLFTATLVLLTIILPALIGSFFDEVTGLAGVPAENGVFLIYLSSFFVGGYFFIQLLAIVLTADAVCSEWQNRTIFLLLSKPVGRTAFVLGKYVGSLLTIAGTVAVLFLVDYLVVQGMHDGAPGAVWVGRFLGALGILLLGAAAFAALSLFFSTITKGTVTSLLWTLAMWIFVLPLLAQTGLFITLADEDWDGDTDSARVDWSRYLSPGTNMAVASRVLVNDAEGADFFGFLTGTPEHTGLAIVAQLGFIGLFVGLSVLVVRRRNFE